MRAPIILMSATVALLASTALTRAEIGVPAAPGGVYVSVGSGYHHENGSDVAAEGTTSTGPGNNGRGAGSPVNGTNTSARADGNGGNEASAGNGMGSAAFAGGGTTTKTETGATFFSGPGGSAGASSAHGGNGVASATNATANAANTAAGGRPATQATAIAINTSADTSAAASARGSYGAFATANANLSGSVGAAEAAGAGATASASAANAGESVSSSSDGGSFLRAQSGAFGDVEIGYVLPNPIYNAVTRVEVYATGSMATQTDPVQGGFGFRGVDNNSAIAVAASPYGAVDGSLFQRERLGEIGLRIKADRRIGRVFAALSGEPFYLDFRQLTASYAGGANSYGERLSSVHGQLYGAQLAAEVVLPVFNRVSLVGRASAGIYGAQSSGAFASAMSTTAGSPTAAAVAATAAASNFAFLTNLVPMIPTGGQFAAVASDSQGRVGARLGAQGGVRYEITPAAWFTVLGSVDYLSSVPTAVLPRYAGDAAAHIASRGFTDVRVGGRLTLATLGAS